MEERPTTGLLLIGLLTMTVLCAVFGYLYYHERGITRQQEEDLEVRVTELAAVEIKLDSIAKQLDTRIAEVKGLGGNITELQKQKAQLEADRSALRRGNTALNEAFKNKVKEYEQFLIRKDTELALLRKENQQLLSQNESLTAAKSTLEQHRQLLSDSLLEIQDINRDLESKVNLASALRARELKVYAVSAKGKLQEGESVRARRIDKIRVDFRLEKNPLATTESKTIYLRILDPDGATLSDTGLGSGTFEYQGQSETFTLSKVINYTNTNQEVSVLYDRPGAFRAGTYTVELYAEGFRIGEGTFSVR
ncbi:hypothetical protein GCM10027275_04510 [Rhabdobacter roseus]|uniref:Putative nuclease with TOPRIM domain n=1 Tax=Rhabdobacter roseus TaxID=1655419 RepID=A0A840TLA2_9BACT|nr:hypothetical protein [Rhabdobacter roseus]MBB5282342.1 putative nuclease with TOPRIM domain [Rhabdobacter roseus]